MGRSRRTSPLRESSGQIAILFGVILLLTSVMGVLAVDVGYLLTSRRDAQADADFIALAGAIELPDFDAINQVAAAGAATTAARDWALRNGVDPDSELEVQVLWNDDNDVGDFDFMFIESSAAAKVQFVASEDVADQTGFVLNLLAGIPIMLHDDLSSDISGETTMTHVDTWESNWDLAATLDRVEYYQSSGSAATVRIFVAT